MSLNHRIPPQNAGLHPPKKVHEVNSITTKIRPRPTQKVLRLPKEFRYFDALINDNSDNIIIKK